MTLYKYSGKTCSAEDSPYLVVWQELGAKSQPLWPWLECIHSGITVKYLDRVTDAQPTGSLEAQSRIAPVPVPVLLCCFSKHAPV